METRILIADRQAMFREVLKRLLELQPDFIVVADTGDGEQLVKLAAKHTPDILLLDLNLFKKSGLEALHRISKPDTGPRAILLTDTVRADEAVQALLLGVQGIVRKEDPTDMLFKSIRAVMAGQYWINHEQVSNVVENLRSLGAMVEKQAQQQARSLSRQQQQIVEAIVAGCSNKEIAKDLSISERTVKYHLTRIFETFGVSGRMALARYSLEKKVVREA